ncbi:divergent PAP2 family protein [Thiospirochaeta perfilievii]|uniref:Divergent PAP2 family protein n=1 Tax=Thiospirochaeta perfilievii TaxID=252967 RepID=A0A5C1Q7T5_9SPIO|nr:divergent PAP2 family protein [Thiospirochaeta perfilievii]QEN04133.1 divergent PAP2 family protein [Thiospirochaeta perfilievii]
MNLNITIVIGFASTLLAQIIKVLVILISERRVAWDMITSTGGMPSSHSAGVVAAATSVGLIDGWGSTTFAVACALAIVVMYDATGVRRAAGLHAEYLNVIAKELSHIFKQDGQEQKALKTLLGHTYLQVTAGMIQGVFVALIFHFYIFV